MKIINRKRVIELKPAFIAWMECNWCDCVENRANETPGDKFNVEWDDCDIRRDGHPCECYGRNEYDDIHRIDINDDGTILLPMCDYSDPTQLDPSQRAVLYTPDDDEIWTHYPHQTYGGDDYDYYQPIIRWILATLMSPLEKPK